MMEAVLGVGLFGHDASASLVCKQTGVVLFSVTEERISNIKHDWHFPIGSIRKSLGFSLAHGYTVTDVAVNFDEDLFVTGTLKKEIERLWEGLAGAEQFADRLLDVFHLGEEYAAGTLAYSLIEAELKKSGLPAKRLKELRKRIGWYYNWGIKYRRNREIVQDMDHGLRFHKVPHHLCHASSAFFNSGFDDATILTIDGQGESDTATVGLGDSQGVKILTASSWPFSLGVFYLNATLHLGFNLGDEYKVMGMAAYGSPKYLELLQPAFEVTNNAELKFRPTEYFDRREVNADGHFCFNFTEALHKIIPHRKKTDQIRQVHFDFAASVQKVTEEVGVELAKKAIIMTGRTDLVVAGGVGLNGLMNERIRRASGCTRMFIFPAAGDDGTSIGAAQYVARKNCQFKSQKLESAYLGFEADNKEIKDVLETFGLAFDRPASIHKAIANALAGKKIVARYVGRSEVGPRALGNRSILADPRDRTMKEILNERIKHREPFRPFAPACLRERMGEYFDIDVDAPFMLFIVQAKEKAVLHAPAVVHHDNSARVQSVSLGSNPDLYQIISQFERLTGVPIVANTSFNVNGEAIVDTPRDAIESFGHMDIDCLAIGDYFVEKEANKGRFPTLTDKEYLQKRIRRYQGSGVWPYSEYSLSGIRVMEKSVLLSEIRRLRRRLRGWIFDE